MSALVAPGTALVRPSPSSPLPLPRLPLSIRPGTLADLPFIDALQKRHAKQVGWMPRQQLEGKVGQGQVLVAEENPELGIVACGSGRPAGHNPESRIGYCIASDRYFKRDDVGIIYQMNVVPEAQRSLVGAALLKAVFERAAYGCKLYCCWCAQDIAANKFWEAMGFVPLAFRAGSEKKSRVHIFWQKRIRSGDEATPYWFPSQTGGGSIREDRLVLPIPPGTHWSDAKPLILPREEAPTPALPRGTGRGSEAGRAEKPKVKGPSRSVAVASRGGLWFAPPKLEAKAEEKPAKAAKGPRTKRKHDPRLVAAARELRDRWLERVNAGAAALPVARGKYEVRRGIEGEVGVRLALPM